MLTLVCRAPRNTDMGPGALVVWSLSWVGGWNTVRQSVGTVGGAQRTVHNLELLLAGQVYLTMEGKGLILLLLTASYRTCHQHYISVWGVGPASLGQIKSAGWRGVPMEARRRPRTVPLGLAMFQAGIVTSARPRCNLEGSRHTKRGETVLARDFDEGPQLSVPACGGHTEGVRGYRERGASVLQGEASGAHRAFPRLASFQKGVLTGATPSAHNPIG